MDATSSFGFFSEFVLSVKRSSTTMRTRFVSVGLDVYMFAMLFKSVALEPVLGVHVLSVYIGIMQARCIFVGP